MGKQVKPKGEDVTEKPKQRPSWKDRQKQKSKVIVQQLKGKKTEVEKKLSVAQHATASAGHFNKKAHRQERQMKMKRRKEYRNFKNVDEQVERNKDVLGQVITASYKKLNHSI